jgi:hypothetical protein
MYKEKKILMKVNERLPAEINKLSQKKKLFYLYLNIRSIYDAKKKLFIYISIRKF